ncbi:ABC transporter permease subunit [Thioclava sp. BHET1]|nr:ABC transporter permease subunit [Thioclava sp. BHET1]
MTNTNAARVSAPPAGRKARLRLDTLWLSTPGLLYLAALLIVPAGALIVLSFRNPQTGVFDLSVYRQMFSAGVYVKTMINTFGLSLEVTLVCLGAGYPVAYWLAGLTPNRRRLAMWFVLLPFWVSPLLKSFAWIVLLARKGIVAETLHAIGIDAGQHLLYGRGAVVFGMAHSMLPIAILTMLPTMLGIDRRLVSAAQTMGASRAQAFWRVFLPLSMPGVTAAALLIFVMGLGFFITPALLGSPRETVIGQLLITEVQKLFNMRLAGALSTLLLAVTLVTIALYDRIFGMSSVSGEGGTGRRPERFWARIGTALLGLCAALSDAVTRILPKGCGGWFARAFVYLVLFLLIVPVLAFPPMAFSGSSFLEFPPHSFSLKWFNAYLSSAQWTGATFRSAIIAIAVGALASLVAAFGAYGMARSRKKAGGLVFLAFLLPMIVPNVVIAVALFYVFAKLGLIATNIGIILGQTLTALPVVFVILLTTFRAVDWRLLQAAGTLGANRWNQLRLILLPLVTGGVVAAFLFGLLNSFEELTIAMFVGAGVRQTLPKQMWDDVLISITPTLAAASVIVILVVTVLFVIAEKYRPR